MILSLWATALYLRPRWTGPGVAPVRVVETYIGGA